MEKKILIYDDDILIMQTTNQLLNLMGYNCYTANNASEVYSIIKNNSINIFIIDFNLEKEKSDEIIKNIKNNFPTLKIILSSGFHNPKFDDENINKLVDGYLNKPYTLEELKKIIENI